jgi:hypothetical protein
LDKPLGLREGEGLQQYGIYYREDRGIGSDAKSERQGGGDGESGARSHPTKGVAHVLRYLLQRHQTHTG